MHFEQSIKKVKGTIRTYRAAPEQIMVWIWIRLPQPISKSHSHIRSRRVPRQLEGSDAGLPAGGAAGQAAGVANAGEDRGTVQLRGRDIRRSLRGKSE